MSLPAPLLDDRTFQELVDEARRRIRRHCPEWTDHNISDPGITLIELFAWMTELSLYRLNQVPERNYIKFLELLGVSLTSPTPASVELHFRLSRPIADSEGEEVWERTLPAYETIAATVRTETDEAIEFATSAELTLRRPRIAYLLAVAAADGGQSEADTYRNARVLPVSRIAPESLTPDTDTLPTFPIFSQPPISRPRESGSGDALYIGFENDLSGTIISLDADCIRAAAPNLLEEYPSQLWEGWNDAGRRWEQLTVLADSTFGFNRTGSIEIVLPSVMVPLTLGERNGFWIRCRYTTDPVDLPPRPATARGGVSGSTSGIEENGATLVRPNIYTRSPEVRSVRAKTLGGSVWGSNCATVFNEFMGRSDGLPGQRFALKNQSILPRSGEEVLLLGDTGDDEIGDVSRWEVWKEVANFARSDERDRHFTLDSATGEICFGPRVRQPDGGYVQHGAIPDRGRRILFRRYRHGGGTQGNVRESQINVVKSAIPYIRSVSNPRRATGGADRETLQHAIFRSQAQMQQRERAVTTTDFEALAESVPGVGRARCLHPERIYSTGEGNVRVPPGVVRVLLVPRLGKEVLTPRPRDLHLPDLTRQSVVSFLDRCRLLTTVLDVRAPRYVFISTDIVLVADPRHEPFAVAARVRESLSRFLHPLTGGPIQTGWPFRRALTLSDIYAQVQAAQGVAFLLKADIFYSEAVGESDRLGVETRVDPARGYLPDADTLLCTREHRIQVRSMTDYEQESGTE